MKIKNKSNLWVYSCLYFILAVAITLTLKFTPSKVSFIVGLMTMIYLSLSILYSVHLSLLQKTTFLSFLVLFLKAPITILIIFLLYRSGHFESFSFMTGVLIVLPILVILSYRKQ